MSRRSVSFGGRLPNRPGATLAQPVTLSGWAIDTGTSTGTGVSSVRVLAYLNGTGTPIGLGDATYGGVRTDVQQMYAAYGSGFAPSGFEMPVRGLAPGTYKLVAEAFSTVTQTYNQLREITVTLTANPWTALDVPATGTRVNQTFTIMGWAADIATASGTGVDVVHVYALPNPGSGTPAVMLGAATYGASRPDVGAYFGSQFDPSGYALTTTLSPGVYQLTAYAHSSFTGLWSAAQSVTVTVATSSPVIAIDVPTGASPVSVPFTIAGWAIDTGAPSGTGIDLVTPFAYPNGDWGQPIDLSAGTSTGGSRPDVAAAYGNTQFTNSGYGKTVTSLAPGTYLIAVWVHSTVSGQWSWQGVWVTVQ